MAWNKQQGSGGFRGLGSAYSHVAEHNSGPRESSPREANYPSPKGSTPAKGAEPNEGSGGAKSGGGKNTGMGGMMRLRYRVNEMLKQNTRPLSTRAASMPKNDGGVRVMI